MPQVLSGRRRLCAIAAKAVVAVPLPGNVRFGLPAQPVDATQALNLSAGVWNAKVSRGRSLSWRATLFRCAWEWTDKSVPLGKYCRSKPLVFSLEPRCQGLCGSQKYTAILVANVKRR